MNLNQITLVIIVFLFSPVFLIAKKEPDTTEKDAGKIEQVKMGNFALSASQQPAPLICFGQNIIDKGDLQLFICSSQLKGTKKNFKEIALTMIYGIKDNASFSLRIPFAYNFRENNLTSLGLEDSFMQFEYAFYSKGTLTTTNQMTFVANISLPVGSTSKQPCTGLGSPGFFLGFTANHITTDWYCFISSGALLTTRHKNTKTGNQFLYQSGLGKNISSAPNKWIFNWLIELDGFYIQRDITRKTMNQNSGGNEILLGPSLWFSTQHLILQAGISWAISHHMFGVQNRDSYLLAINCGWTF
jgi:hypothetical protein